MTPLVSVVIPTFNRADLLPATLDSVLGQTLEDIQVIVVDDGSTDDTPEFMAGVTDPRVEYIRNPWSGHPSVGRNTGLRAARGRYLALVDSDDLWLPDKLAAQAAFLEAEPDRLWCFTHYDFLEHPSGRIEHRPLPAWTGHGAYAPGDLLRFNFIGSPCLLMRREAVDRVGPYDEAPALRFVEDWEFCLRLSAAQPGGFLPEPLALYRLHDSAATHAPDPLAIGLRCLEAMDAAVAKNPETYAPHYARAARGLLPDMVRRLLVLGRNRDARQLCRRTGLAPWRAPNLALYKALALLPRPVLRSLLTLNRGAKAALGR